MKIIINENNNGLKRLKKIYNDEGLLALKNLTSINSYDLVKILDLTIDAIDFPMVFMDLLDDGLIPNEYNGFTIEAYDDISDDIRWTLETKNYGISFLVTSFFDEDFFDEDYLIAIDVVWYTDDKKGITLDSNDLEWREKLSNFETNIPIDEEMTYFSDYDSILNFITNFYYPKVYEKLKEIIAILQGNIK
jgi:hypothetical protein